MAGIAEDEEQAAKVRAALVDELRMAGMITSPGVEAAFRAVPRHRFAPADTPLEVAYNAWESVVTKTDQHGVAVSSISAPFIQARMIEQAELRTGMSVLEIGSGGYNAALLAEAVGADGHVVSVDIDPEVTERAQASLDATGYGSRVTVVLADAEHSVAEHAPTGRFDRIIVTVGAWDIPPAWLDELSEDGIIVVPLRMKGITRSIAFHRTSDHLVSTSAEVCGFVPMQGDGQRVGRVLLLPDPQGRQVKLRFEDEAPDDPDLLDGVLATDRTEIWSGATIKHGTSFADLQLWFASFLGGFCQLDADEGTELAEGRGKSWFPYGVVRGDSFAYLAVRPALGGAGIEFGARAYGAHGELPATAMVEEIRAWDQQARDKRAPQIAFWPSTDHARLPADAAVLEKSHGLVTISWPETG